MYGILVLCVGYYPTSVLVGNVHSRGHFSPKSTFWKYKYGIPWNL